MDSSPFQFDPYAPGQSEQRRATHMEYLASYSYYFESPNWFLNLLLVTLCQFIPIVGPIAVLGYEYEVILAKHLGQTRTYPDFDFGRFPDYLKRGVWPFLVQLLLSLLTAPLMFILIFSSMAVFGFTSAGSNPNPLILLFGFVISFLFVVVLSIVSTLVMTPLVLRAGLTQDFGQAFDMTFVKDFIRRAGWETLLAMGFLMISGPIVVLAGLLVCFVGIYPASMIVLLAYTHLKWQLYELYLARGGEPIPLPEDEIVQAERV